MESTPKANRLHIGFFGKCNVGKSTLVNLITGQDISLVSDVAGTTTDPVTKSMEILPLGPVMLVDTAGVDDTSPLGKLRIGRTQELLPKMNLALYILKTDEDVQPVDLEWLETLKSQKLSVLLVINEVEGMSGDAYVARNEALSSYQFSYITLNASKGEKQKELLDRMGRLVPSGEETVSLLEGIMDEGDTIILVCPIDSAAPKGRIILPQVQMIREILDRRGQALVVQTEELAVALESLKLPPRLVITDSQAFETVARIVPAHIPLTSFSILMARFKGNLKHLVAGARAIKDLKPKSKVLISEGCTHHRQCDDIGTVKIPKWFAKAGFTDLDLHWTSGGKFPQDVSQYDLIVHCGACMLTRREVLRRIDASVYDGVPIVNYGVLIAYLHGILERALTAFEKELL